MVKRQLHLCVFAALMLCAMCLFSACGELRSEDGMTLASLLSGDICSVSIFKNGAARELSASEIDELLEAAEAITYSRSAGADMSKPGAASVIITAGYGDGVSKSFTLPYYSEDGVTYDAKSDSIYLISPFFDEQS